MFGVTIMDTYYNTFVQLKLQNTNQLYFDSDKLKNVRLY